MARVEVITGPERRGRWSAEQKRAIVAASLAPGAVVTQIARRADICAGQAYRWRREIGVGNGFAQVLVAPVGDGAGVRRRRQSRSSLRARLACASRLRSRPGWRRPWSNSEPVNPEWSTWPAIAAIALSELMYLGWMVEGEAASQELIAISRRWSRRRSDLPQSQENVKTESDAPRLPAVPTTVPQAP
jgi:transposase